MQFDWYQATLNISSSSINTVLSVFLAENDLSSSQTIRGINCYDQGIEVYRGSNTLVRIYWSNLESIKGIHVVSSGYQAIKQSEIIRKHFPDHGVARADSCADYIEPHSFDDLCSLALNIADKRYVKVVHQGDWHRAFEGRTLYLGSRSSVAQLCIYEKGKQLDKDPNWARIELRIRPSSKSKSSISNLSPEDLWGCSRWSAELYEHLTTLNAKRTHVGVMASESDLSRAYTALIKQYGNTISKVAGAVGDYESFGLLLQKDISNLKQGKDLLGVDVLSLEPNNDLAD
jgi:hypothetical protein